MSGLNFKNLSNIKISILTIKQVIKKILLKIKIFASNLI